MVHDDNINWLARGGYSEPNTRSFVDRSGATNYVEYGLEFRPQWDRDRLITSVGVVHIHAESSGRYYEVEADRRVDVQLPADTRSDVYAIVDESDLDEPRLVVEARLTPPSDPHLHIGAIDTSTETFDDTLATEPEQQTRALSVGGGQTIGQSVEHIGPRSSLTVGLREGLVGHWPLTDRSEGLRDTVNGNDVELVGEPEILENAGAFGDGLLFGSGENYGRIPHDGALSVEDGDFSISAYIRVPDAQDTAYSESANVIHKRGESSGDTQMCYGMSTNWGDAPSRGNIAAGFGNNATVHFATSEIEFGEGPLEHIEFQFDHSTATIRVYLNGYLVARDSPAATPIQNDEEVRIGTKLNGAGDIDHNSPIVISDLRIYNRVRSLSEIQTAARLPYVDAPTFDIQRRSDGAIWPNHSGPCYRYDEGQTEPHRLLVKDNSQSGNPTQLYTATTLSTDPADWTTAATDLFGAAANTAATEPSDFVSDGSTYYVYATDDVAGSQQLWTGSDWTSLTQQSTAVVGDDQDCGAFREEDGTTHIFAEDADNAIGFGSNILSHWVADAPDGSFEEVEQAFDARDLPWHIGDPDIERIDGVYWMFLDNCETHPHYGTCLLWSRDLYDWELLAEDIKKGKAGDLEVARDAEGELVGFAELSGGGGGGVDMWDVYGPQ